MRSLELLALALNASALLLLAHGSQRSNDGVYPGPVLRPSAPERPTAYHLPTYMMHLYRNFRSNFSRPLDTLERRAAQHADTVQSVMAKSLTHRQGRWIATFDLHALLADKQIQAAELRIRLPHSAANITVEVLHQNSHMCPAHRGCQEQQLVGLLAESSLVTSSHSWKVFNVTAPLLSWLRRRTAAAAIQLKRLPGRMKEAKTKRGLLLDTSVYMMGAREQDVSERALLVIFSHTGSDEKSKAKATLLHTAEQSKFLSAAEVRQARWPRRRRSKRGHREQTVRSLMTPKKGGDKTLCRRVDLRVDFNKIGWGSWIIFPKKYNAYRCEGSCPGPLGEDLNPTNHAYMQSLLKHYHPERVTSPCCAPTKMSPLSMLYYENGEMLLRHHEDMIVDECGCQ
ncbi:nodal-related 2 [Takifugu flavidus]|uniref:Nodal-like protein n=1 Tax=Takifugu flavidus TaxID=433684 RepID=A0A5C6PQK8_9TELE|nr:nodal-related 2 [Takifugu flavidus]TWW81944.1 Nodal -like protein [Takifugu flavidus]